MYDCGFVRGREGGRVEDERWGWGISYGTYEKTQDFGFLVLAPRTLNCRHFANMRSGKKFGTRTSPNPLKFHGAKSCFQTGEKYFTKILWRSAKSNRRKSLRKLPVKIFLFFRAVRRSPPISFRRGLSSQTFFGPTRRFFRLLT